MMKQNILYTLNKFNLLEKAKKSVRVQLVIKNADYSENNEQNVRFRDHL